MALDQVLSKLFNGYNVCGPHAASLPIVDFDPLLEPKDMETLADGLNSAIDWEDVTAIVGLAERSSGPLSHLLAHRRRLPYSLVNWYPEGSEGEIKVGPAVSFTGEKGNTFLNGLAPISKFALKNDGKPDCVVYVDDCLRKGTNARKVVAACKAAGVQVKGCAFVAEIVGTKGKELLEKDLGVPVVTLCQVDASSTDKKTEVVNVVKPEDDETSPHQKQYKPAVLPTAAEIKAMSGAQLKPKFQRCLEAFINRKIYYAAGSTYPYVNFPLTDFQPMPHPDLIEDMAICMVWLGNFERCDILVSEADRGGGPLVIAVSRITGLPYTLANWEPPANKNMGVKAGAQVGYSGTGSLYVNGIPKGARCAVVDDMLSSGGTAEGLFRAIEAAGGVVTEGHFASEKVNTGGRVRLGKNWPTVPMYSLCYFLAHGPQTTAYPPGPLAHATPLQIHDAEAQAELEKMLQKKDTPSDGAEQSLTTRFWGNIDKIAFAAIVLCYFSG